MAPTMLANAAVGAGAALGAVARYMLTLGLISALGPAFPWGTLAANVTGSFIICLYFGLPRPDASDRAGLDRFLAIGFCGGFTTFSVFSLEVLLLAGEDRMLAAATYLAASLIAWLAAGWTGFALAARLSSRRSAA